MSSSRPIITTNVPGCKETVKNGYNGFLVNYNDNDALFEAINKFIKNLNLIKKKIKANKDKELRKILTNSKKVRKQIIDWKQDVSKPDFGREI